MCQSKANGGKRCSYHNKIRDAKNSANKSSVLKSSTLDISVQETSQTYSCPRCGFKANRANPVVHRCIAKDLVPLTPATTLIINAISKAGGRPLIVGGSVRDAILANGEHHIPKDIDIEAYGLSVEELAKALNEVGKVGEVGRDFSVLKMTIGDEDFDISLPRIDSKIGRGHKGFNTLADYNLDEVTAFGRRDFTINSMGWDPQTQELVDPYGGLADLESKILRHTSPAFSEDPLRVMRGIQFAGRFGFTFAPETIIECQTLVDSFSELPTERIWTEWEKIATKATWPSKSLQALHDTGWENNFPELLAIRGVTQGNDWHPEGSVDIHTSMAADKAAEIALRDSLTAEERVVVLLATISHDLGKATHTEISEEGRVTSHGHAEAGEEPARALLSRLGAPLHIQYQVSILVREHMAHAGTSTPSSAAVRRLIRRLDGNGTGPSLEQWARVVEADVMGRGAPKENPATRWVNKASELGSTKPTRSILRGEHLASQGLPPGIKYKTILSEALLAQDEDVFIDEEGAINWLKDWIIRNN